MTATIADHRRPRRPATSGRSGRRWPPRAVAGLLAALTAAWGLPLAAHAAGLDVLLVPVVIGAAATLPRSRASVADRLVLATTGLAGLLIPAALLGTWWPAMLHPVVLAGTALSATVLLAALRPPRRAGWRRPGGVDAVVATAWAALVVLLGYPVLRHGAAFRLGLALGGEDRARHFALTDAIGRIGGYALAGPRSPTVLDSIQQVQRGYPQGFHLLAAVAETFWTGGARAGDPVAALSRFVVVDALCYALLGGAVIWALRRVAGPAATVLTLLPLAGLAVGYLYFGDLLAIWYQGFAPETAGLAFLVVAVALLARPLPDTREQVLLVAIAVTALAWTYYPLLPVAGAALLAGAVPMRHRLRRHWVFATVVAVAAAALVALPSLLTPAQASVSMLFANYGVFPMRLPALLAPAALVLAALAVPPAARRRAPSVTTPLATTLAAAALTAAVGVAQVYRLGHTAYFYHKYMHAVAVLVLVLAGTAAGPLRRLLRGGRVRATVAAVTLAALALACYAAPAPPRPAPGGPVVPSGAQSWGRAYWDGDLADTAAGRLVIRLYRAVPNPGRRITVLDMGDWLVNYKGTLYLDALRRDMGRTWPGYVYGIHRRAPAAFVALVRGHPGLRYQIISVRPQVLAALEALRRARPDLDVQVVDGRPLG